MARFTRAVATSMLMAVAVLAAWTVPLTLHGQAGAPAGAWPTYGGDLGHTRYAPLDQITASNFDQLVVAWRFSTRNLGPTPEYKFQSTPLVVNGVLYSTGGTRRSVVALDAATGELLWVYGLREGARAAHSTRKLSGRGLAYWTDGTTARIFYVTIGYQLVALDAATGAPIPSFGQDGVVDLKQDSGQAHPVDPVWTDLALHATPIVVHDRVLVGSALASGSYPRAMANPKGSVRAYDARTGHRLWIFHTIPQPGEAGHETWEDQSAARTGNTGVWAQISVDPAAGLAYVPVETPTGDYYGGFRPGNNLFSESIVALDLATGRRRWHYQLVHHGLWDLDIPAAPILADVPIDGRVRQILAQPTKQKFLYVFDRLTGAPIWPIEERPVPRGDVPGEWYAPTQPFPTKPPAYGRQDVTPDDLIDFTPALRAKALAVASRLKLGPMYTPPVVRTSEVDGTAEFIKSGTIWEGGAYDPETHLLYVYAKEQIGVIGLAPPDPCGSDLAYVAAGWAPQPPRNEPGRPPCASASAASAGEDGFGGTFSVDGLPLAKPPYATITAIDLTQGTIVWQVPHGDTPDHVKQHPALKGLTLPRTGRGGNVGTLVTKTLLIAGEGTVATLPTGHRGAFLRAYDKATGQEVGAVPMPSAQTGSPMTYMLNGKQYLVVAVSGPNVPGELIAYTLPDR